MQTVEKAETAVSENTHTHTAGVQPFDVGGKTPGVLEGVKKKALYVKTVCDPHQ